MIDLIPNVKITNTEVTGYTKNTIEMEDIIARLSKFSSTKNKYALLGYHKTYSLDKQTKEVIHSTVKYRTINLEMSQNIAIMDHLIKLKEEGYIHGYNN